MKKFKLLNYFFSLTLILFFILLSFTLINAEVISDDEIFYKNINDCYKFYDQLDQYQHNVSFNENQTYTKFDIFYKNDQNYQWCAQSFKPKLPVLTRVNLLIYKTNIPCVFILSIRQKINGNDLVVMSKGSEEIYNHDNVNWISFDFPDINVNINEEYYIVTKCYCGSIDYQNNISCYSWIYGNETDYYNGESWSIKPSNSTELLNYPLYDFCFETYGCYNRPPLTPEIDGVTNGNIGTYYEYTFRTNDPDNDDIYYCVIGGDSNNEICLGPFKSGEEAKATFLWQKSGIYNLMVKARDTYGDESEWGYLEVKMPLNFSNFYLFKYIDWIF